MSSPCRAAPYPSGGSTVWGASGCQEDKSLSLVLALPQREELEAVTSRAAAGGAAFHWGSTLGQPRQGHQVQLMDGSSSFLVRLQSGCFRKFKF
ncbi:hypothetical protein AV530_012134 [Patagioenas fasciata monilis]|uniref:Uncharacterized protein n=1 Tax=Patagioenas fasciata monilis TaxID=372326 RepID=A0A1V4JVE4_PATFA|nr:hypothetical protein AV530_012134 [Patagioenas fasciata monilis]